MDFEDFGQLVAQYNAVLPTLADGDLTELQVDQNGRLLVQANVTVSIDFLGLNGASDDSNILIVGTEDGTATGTAHAFRLESDGRLIISDGGNSITVDAVDLDIRDLDSAQDSVQVKGANGNSIEPNADGSINIVGDFGVAGTENFETTDDGAVGGDGLITISNTVFTDVAEASVGAGQTLNIYGYSTTCDKNATVRIITADGVNEVVYKVAQLNSATPNWSEHWSEGGRIEIAGTATPLLVKVQIKSKSGSANGSGSLHARLV